MMPHPVKINMTELQRLRAAGWRMAELARHFGCTTASICNAIRRGENAKPAADPRPPTPAWSYASVQEIAETKGLSQRQALAEFHRRRA